MATAALTVEERIRQATLRVRARMLVDLVESEKRLTELYGKQATELARVIKGSKPGKKLSQRVEKQIRTLTRRVFPELQQLVESGALKGRETAQAQFAAAFTDSKQPKFPTTPQLMSQVSAQLRGALWVDKIPLSERLWRNNKAVSKRMTSAIQGAVRAGTDMQKIAKEILEVDTPLIRQPEYIARLADAAKRAAETGDPNLLTDAVAKYRAQIDKLGSVAGPLFDQRTATNRLIRDIQGATAAQIEEHVQRYMGEKARQHAVMIARTETIHSYRQGYYESVGAQPWVRGIKWNLARRHPHPDICDILANQDVHALGAGGYPKDAIPDNPHPNCMCYQTAIVDKHYAKRRLAQARGEKEPPRDWETKGGVTGADWLKTQSGTKQVQLLGPTRAGLLATHGNEIIDPKTGKIKLVRDIDPALRARSNPPPVIPKPWKNQEGTTPSKHKEKIPKLSPAQQREALYASKKGHQPWPSEAVRDLWGQDSVVLFEQQTQSDSATRLPDIDHLSPDERLMPLPLPERKNTAAEKLHQAHFKSVMPAENGFKPLPHMEMNTGYPDHLPIKSGMTLQEVEDAMRTLDRETAVHFDAAGNIIMRKTVNDAYMVAYTAKERRFLNKYSAVMTHNHPGGGTFSGGDMYNFVGMARWETRAVASKNYTGVGAFGGPLRDPPGTAYSVTPKRGWTHKLKDADKPASPTDDVPLPNSTIDAIRRHRSRTQGIMLRNYADRQEHIQAGYPMKFIDEKYPKLSFDDAAMQAWNEIGSRDDDVKSPGWVVRRLTEAQRHAGD